ncbi:HPr family phosphocarrier protein [Haloquadratum walsbyi]|uniref:Phosphocarrier protein HPr n=1 Tax=Haloquadratum walsbyi (strain DSM 16854 / JCM 12705 / C23) TaxID=768065 RepID=G0LLP2_HALWC|nr:HPr family phosphocarrier protein [Haloquadratum walsbyi]CCC40848.1 phosphocarrier protein HPr [Haloquadratum walsbyi C23]
MPERVVTVVPEDGLHARPASKFVEAANEFDAEVQVGHIDDNPVNAASMLAVTGLAVTCGDDVQVRAEGPDADAALDELTRILSTPEEDL